MNLRVNIQRLRARDALTQEALAEQLHVSRQAVAKWEAGKATPELDKLLELSRVFNCTLDDLVSGTVEAEPAATAAAVQAPVATAEAASVEPVSAKHAQIKAERLADKSSQAEQLISKQLTKKRASAICALIMAAATILAFLLFIPFLMFDNYLPFWMPWPIGGMLCAVVRAWSEYSMEKYK